MTEEETFVVETETSDEKTTEPLLFIDAPGDSVEAGETTEEAPVQKASESHDVVKPTHVRIGDDRGKRGHRGDRPTIDPSPVLFLPNMSYDAQERDLHELSKKCPAKVLKSFLYMSQSSHHGFLQCDTVEDATRNLEWINSNFIEVRGKRVLAEYSKRKSVDDRKSYEQRQSARKETPTDSRDYSYPAPSQYDSSGRNRPPSGSTRGGRTDSRSAYSDYPRGGNDSYDSGRYSRSTQPPPPTSSRQRDYYDDYYRAPASGSQYSAQPRRRSRSPPHYTSPSRAYRPRSPRRDNTDYYPRQEEYNRSASGGAVQPSATAGGSSYYEERPTRGHHNSQYDQGSSYGRYDSSTDYSRQQTARPASAVYEQPTAGGYTSREQHSSRDMPSAHHASYQQREYYDHHQTMGAPANSAASGHAYSRQSPDSAGADIPYNPLGRMTAGGPTSTGSIIGLSAASFQPSSDPYMTNAPPAASSQRQQAIGSVSHPLLSFRTAAPSNQPAPRQNYPYM